MAHSSQNFLLMQFWKSLLVYVGYALALARVEAKALEELSERKNNSLSGTLPPQADQHLNFQWVS